MNACLCCITCKKEYALTDIRYRCNCGEILEVKLDSNPQVKKELFDKRIGSSEFPDKSGVWRFREMMMPIHNKHIVSKPEGNTNLYAVGKSEKSGLRIIGKYVGIDQCFLKHEGENPTGSFKDRGMTVGISKAKELKATAVACASTGNTSASLASYAALAGMKCFVFLPKGKISSSKLSQSIAYGAINIQIDGDFDTAMEIVQDVCSQFGIYLLNSINPFRIEGQKTIGFELLQQLKWQAPDWIVLPGGNLGNTSAIGKGLLELKEMGIIKKLPRIAVIQAKGANPFYQSFQTGFKKRFTVHADTIASAIRIGNPVSFLKARKIIEVFDGVVEEVSDDEILEAKVEADRSGIGCEPASAATVAGIKKLVEKKVVGNVSVAGILTGHILKDPDTITKYHANTLVSSSSKTIHQDMERLLFGK